MVSGSLAPLYTVFGMKLGCSGAAAPIVRGYEKQVKVTFFQILTHKPPKPVSRPKI